MTAMVHFILLCMSCCCGLPGDAWHTMSAQQLLQSLLDGCLPWPVPSSSSSNGPIQDPRLSRIKLDMKMRAYDLRAVQQELDLLAFEMKSYQLGIQDDIEELQQAISQQQLYLAEQLQQQHELEEALLREPVSERYTLYCRLKRADMLANIARGRILLLKQLLCRAGAQQAVAIKAFSRYSGSTGDKRSIAVGAAAALASTDTGDADECDEDLDSDSEADTAPDDAEADAGQGNDAAAAASAVTGINVAAALSPLMRWAPFSGPDPVLTGTCMQPPAQQVLQHVLCP